METLMINIESKSEATFITKLLQKFTSVKNVKSFTKSQREAIIDALEEEEDIRDIKVMKARGEMERAIPLEKAVADWKAKGML